MQGFNRYIPPDYDPKQHSTLNSHQGKKHALGKRAKDIDKGILIVRFELPFNIWCGSCNNHIGAGVRYNAQKRKVGNYYSTPIFAFRCKCHLCSGWFELRTDPKNSRYIVEEGARQQQDEWDPAENGGFAAHDTEAPSASEAPTDVFAHIEKTIDQQVWASQKKERLTELTEASARLSADPYLVSSALRRRFREEKRIALDKQHRDGDIREKYGLGEDIDLGDEGVENGRERWVVARENRKLSVDGNPSSSVTGRGTPTAGTDGDLASRIRQNTARKIDPFGDASTTPVFKSLARGKIKNHSALSTLHAVRPRGTDSPQSGRKSLSTVGDVALGGGLLAGYTSD